MSSNVILNAFNKQFTTFLKELSNILPNNKDLKLFKNMIHVPLMTNKKIIITHFSKYLLQYKEKIHNKDEDFFMNLNLSIFPEKDKIMLFKDIWKNEINDSNKEQIWKYMFVLMKLCEKYYS